MTRFFGPLFELLPGSRAEATQFYLCIAVATLVFGQLMKAVQIDEYYIVISVNEFDYFLPLPSHIGRDKASEPADTVIDMHDIVALRELVQLLQ